MAAARPALAALLAPLLAAACARAPEVGEPPTNELPPSARPKVEIESVSAAAFDRRVIVTYRLTDRGAPITGAAAAALAPSWTLAWLSVEPVSGLPAWRSLILTGSQVAASLPPGGPGTPDSLRLAAVRQPGAESSGDTVELGDGRFTYTFADALPPAAPPGLPDLRSETLRVGVFLRGADGTADTSATFDFVAAGGAPASYATVRDEGCNGCHGTLRAHGGRRVGVKLCLTCHTWLNVDPDTPDPAAMNADRTDTSDGPTLAARAAAKRATDPNPLEFGRLVHRLHRGRNLPTLYRSATCYTSSTKTGVTAPPATALCNVPVLPPTFPANAAPPVPPPPPDDLPWTVPALPFRPGRNTVGPVGLKYSVVGEDGAERVGARIVSRIVNFQAAQTLVEGIGYPQDLRNCDACHAGAPEAGAVVTSISRRTCSGCHPDVWYGPVAVPGDLDAFHMPHSGGPQADDTGCADCHVEKTSGNSRWAPIAELHVPPARSPRFKKPIFEIVDVQGLRAGTPGTPGTPGPATATIRFRVRDAVGTLSPLNAPTPLWDPDPVAPSPVRRALTSLTFRIGGPNTDYVTGGGIEAPSSTGTTTRAFSYAVAAGTATTLPWVAVCKDHPSGTLYLSADASGVFTCTFDNPFANLNLVPGKVDVQGTWTIMIEGRRASSQTQWQVAPYTSTTAPYRPSDSPWYGWILGYDPETDTFRWPGTGETVTEGGENVFATFDVATGILSTSPQGARRRVVSKEKCNACHLRLAFHGGTRVDPDACHFCHAADATDWMYRPRDLRPTVGTGVVLLSAPLEYPPDTTKAWTYWTGDGREERSIQLKTMIHRIHTGEREGAASLEGIRPFLIHTSARAWALIDDIRYPNDLANCEACHLPATWEIESVPATAMPTVANEQPYLLHLPTLDPGTGALLAPASQRHGPSDADATPPVTAACLSCHASGAAADHAASKISSGVERCATCHGKGGAESVRKHHAVP